jgi:hypothetical protein
MLKVLQQLEFACVWLQSPQTELANYLQEMNQPKTSKNNGEFLEN